jgi:hypothetical protein
VKARERREQGVARHAARAVELFAGVRAALDNEVYLGLDLDRLISTGRRLAANPVSLPRSTAAVEIVFDFELLPGR